MVVNIINNFFTAIKEDNNDLVNQYMDYEELLCSLDDVFAEKDNENIEKVKEELFKSITWNIESIDVKGEEATVVVEATNKDFKSVITQWMKELVVSKSLKKEITNELALEKLEKVLKEEGSSKTVIKKITLYKIKDEWKIKVNEDLRDLVYPGVDSVISVLESN